jgi:hypothetical protein
MKKLLFSLLALIAFSTGCSQGTSPEEIADIAYKWEKANFDNDYDEQQKFIYEKGSYEVDKSAKKVDSGLNYKDIRYEIYFDDKSDYYYVFADFPNPKGENTVKDNIVFRKKADTWKVDTSESLDISRDEIRKEFERKACIHCK